MDIARCGKRLLVQLIHPRFDLLVERADPGDLGLGLDLRLGRGEEAVVRVRWEGRAEGVDVAAGADKGVQRYQALDQSLRRKDQ